MISKIDYYGNPKYVEHINITKRVANNGTNYINVLLKFNVTFDGSNGVFEVRMKDRNEDREYRTQILKSPCNLCRLVDGVQSNFIVKAVMSSMTRNGNFIFKCPFGPTTYRLLDIEFDDTFIPKILILKKLQFRVDIKIKIKIVNTKKFVPFFNVQFLAVVTNE